MIALNDPTSAEDQNLFNKNHDPPTELTKHLTFLINKQIPQAQELVDHVSRMLERVSTRSMMHRIYYEKSVDAQRELDWVNNARDILEKAISHGDMMTVDKIGDLGDAKRVLLHRMRLEEQGYAA